MIIEHKTVTIVDACRADKAAKTAQRYLENTYPWADVEITKVSLDVDGRLGFKEGEARANYTVEAKIVVEKAGDPNPRTESQHDDDEARKLASRIT